MLKESEKNLKKQIQIFNAKKMDFEPRVIGAKSSAVIQTGLELPPRRDSGVILNEPISEAVSRLVKTLREKEKVV